MLHPGQGKSCSQSRLGDKQIQGSLTDKNVGVLVGERLNMSWPCALAAQKAKLSWAASKHCEQQGREVILSL